jgi:hypothetical protein
MIARICECKYIYCVHIRSCVNIRVCGFWPKFWVRSGSLMTICMYTCLHVCVRVWECVRVYDSIAECNRVCIRLYVNLMLKLQGSHVTKRM